jgi:hypothetical protein
MRGNDVSGTYNLSTRFLSYYRSEFVMMYSLGIGMPTKPSTIAIVGRHLLASVIEVLGQASSPELIQCWSVAYEELAAIMTGVRFKPACNLDSRLSRL